MPPSTSSPVPLAEEFKYILNTPYPHRITSYYTTVVQNTCGSVLALAGRDMPDYL